jgi:hypothetical protein
MIGFYRSVETYCGSAVSDALDWRSDSIQIVPLIYNAPTLIYDEMILQYLLR